jgi:hypothetical protein
MTTTSGYEVYDAPASYERPPEREHLRRRSRWGPAILVALGLCAAFALGYMAHAAVDARSRLEYTPEVEIERTWDPGMTWAKIQTGQAIAARPGGATGAVSPADPSRRFAGGWQTETNAATAALNMAALEEATGRYWVETSAPPLSRAQIAATNAATGAFTLEALDDVGALGPDDEPNPVPTMTGTTRTWIILAD